MKDFFRRWSQAAVINFMLVAVAGVILRYKILFHLPAVNHKNVLHAHSHFAFSGWVSLALCVSIVYVLYKYNNQLDLRKYTRLFYFSQIASFGMLLTFPFMGYAWPSISFSTLYIFFSYIFTWVAWKDLTVSAVPAIVQRWFKSALFLWVISSAGAFMLAYLMASKNSNQNLQIGSIYFFLHFQYNGWFLFAIGGLFFEKLLKTGLDITIHNKAFYLLLIGVVPAFLLSALWMELGMPLYIIAVLSAAVQLIGLFYMGRFLPKSIKLLEFTQPRITRWLWALSLAAVLLKFLFQALSTIPQLSHLAFGFRPIVIGFLHLILLGFVSLFIVGYLLEQNILFVSKTRLAAAALLAIAVVLNETVLFFQGIGAMNYQAIPYTNEMLLGISVVLLGSIATLAFGGVQKEAT